MSLFGELFEILTVGFVETVINDDAGWQSSDEIAGSADKLKYESKSRFNEAKEKTEKARRLVNEALNKNAAVKNEVLKTAAGRLKMLRPEEQGSSMLKKGADYIKQNRYSKHIEPVIRSIEEKETLPQIVSVYKEINSALLTDSPQFWPQFLCGSRISQAEDYYDEALDYAIELDSQSAKLAEAQTKLHLIENTLNSETKLLKILNASFEKLTAQAAHKFWLKKKEINYLLNTIALIQESLAVKITDEQGNVSERQKEILNQIEIIERELTCL